MIDENQVRMTGSIILSLVWTLLVSTLLFALSGCGGGDDPPGDGRVKVSVTDGPLDDAASVVVQFSGVAFKREGEAAEVVRNPSPSVRQRSGLSFPARSPGWSLDPSEVRGGGEESPLAIELRRFK